MILLCVNILSAKKGFSRILTEIGLVEAEYKSTFLENNGFKELKAKMWCGWFLNNRG